MSTTTNDVLATHLRSAAPGVVLTPADTILRSFNVFKIGIGPEQIEASEIFNFLRKCTKDPVPSEFISEPKGSKMTYDYQEQQSTQKVKEELSISVGVKGKYGVYSGSVQVDYSNETSMATTYFHSRNKLLLNFGSVNYSGGDAAIASLLDPALKTALNGITNMQQAAAFTKEWGTHLVKAVNTGGCLFVELESSTSTLDEKSKVSSKVEAEYKAVASVSATASAIYNVSRFSEVKTVKQRISAIGGDLSKALLIDGSKPETLATWAASCNKDAVYSVSDTVEIYTLADAGPGAILKKYIHLRMLEESLNHPAMFMAVQSLKPYDPIQVSVTPDSTTYKVIGGGAAATKGCSSYLTGSYPSLDNEGKIIGWVASSHDIAIPASTTDKLSVYAFAIYDPENYLDVKLETASVSNKKEGPDTVTATLASEWKLTGGGSRVSIESGALKYIMGSYPKDRYNWCAVSRDYMVGATAATLTSFIIGVKSKESTLEIKSNYVERKGDGPNQHGNEIAKASSCLCGGGVNVNLVVPNGNLVQMTYPANPKWWEEYNSDMAGLVSATISAAYAIYLTAKLNV